MGNRYLIVSDLHLCDVEDHPDGWMYHKASKYLFDESFASLLADFTEKERNAGRLTLILNGDIFDFDLVRAVPDAPPWPVSRAERKRGLDATEEKSVWKLERILSHHPRFVQALVDFLCDGHRVVYVMGNHDREFHFPAVERAFRSWLRAVAQDSGECFPDDAIVVEPWFFVEPGEIYVEHGHQYDAYTTFRYLLSPTVRMNGREVLALPMGNLANRYLMTRMGFFNPHASDYALTLFRYVEHWIKYYAFSRRSLALTWLFGSLAVVYRSIMVTRHQLAHPPSVGRYLSMVARRYGLDPATLRALHRLQQPPITSRLFRLLRELWIDRLIAVAILAAGTLALWAGDAPAWVKVIAPLLLGPAFLLGYEKLADGETIFSIEERLPRVARKISRLVPVRVVCFGHSHVPRMLPLSRDVTFIDSGAWAPITRKHSLGQLEHGYRDYARIAFDNGEPSIVFDSWLEDPRSAWKAREAAREAFGQAAPDRTNQEPARDFWWIPSHLWEPAPSPITGVAGPLPSGKSETSAPGDLAVGATAHRTSGPQMARAAEPRNGGKETSQGADPWWTPATWLDNGRAGALRSGENNLPPSVKTAEWDVLLSGAA